MEVCKSLCNRLCPCIVVELGVIIGLLTAILLNLREEKPGPGPGPKR